MVERLAADDQVALSRLADRVRDDPRHPFETNADALAGPSETVSGTVCDGMDVAGVDALVFWLDDGSVTPRSVVLNRWTKVSWPSSWGPARPVATRDQLGAVDLPPETLRRMAHLTIIAHVRTALLAGTSRQQAFALDAAFR